MTNVTHSHANKWMFSNTDFLKVRKAHTKKGTWNVRTLNQSGKLENLISEADNMNTDMLHAAATR